jgi:hypothetical protein
MKLQSYTLILILVIHLNNCFSQSPDTNYVITPILFSFGPELGFSFISQKGENSTYLSKNLNVSPLYSQLIGIQGDINIVKSFKIKLAVQYNKTGYSLPFDNVEKPVKLTTLSR